MENKNFRFYVKTRNILGIKPKVIWNELKTAYKKQAPSYAFVTKWVRLFKNGRKRLSDEPRFGRPITALTTANIEEVQIVIDEDPYATYDIIADKTSLNRNTIYAIIHDHLKKRKIASRWVPHELSTKNKQDRVEICKENLEKFKSGKWRKCDVVTGDEKFFYARQIGHKKSYASWVNEGEAPRTIVNREQSDLKWLFTIFFKSSGILHVSHLDRGDTIDYSYYIRNNLSPLVAAIKSQRPLSGLTNMKFHHDNARPHVHKSVKIYLESKGFTVMRHPPYSPDLAPSDFWLFDYIQTRLSDHPDVESLHKQITEIVKNIPEAEYQKTFQKWIERMEYCIEYRGEYFEHLLK